MRIRVSESVQCGEDLVVETYLAKFAAPEPEGFANPFIEAVLRGGGEAGDGATSEDRRGQLLSVGKAWRCYESPP